MSLNHGFTHYTGDTVTQIKKWKTETTEIHVHTLRLPIVGTGQIQRCTLLMEPPEKVELASLGPIFLLDSLELVKACPAVEALLASHLFILHRVDKDSITFPFPNLIGTEVFAHPPVSPGVFYNSESKMSTEGGLHLWFRCHYPEPIPVSAFLRFMSFGT